MGRILAIDYGLKRTGIAVSDPMRIIAGGLETVPTAQLEQWLGQYMAANDVDIIVVGKPTQMNGAPSQSWAAIEPFVKRLEARYPDCRVVLHLNGGQARAVIHLQERKSLRIAAGANPTFHQNLLCRSRAGQRVFH